MRETIDAGKHIQEVPLIPSFLLSLIVYEENDVHENGKCPGTQTLKAS